MLKYLLVAIVFLISLVSVNASLELTELGDSYDTGNGITLSVKIIPEMDVLALISANILCEEYEETYFITPVDLKEGEEVIVDVPSLQLFDKMIGTCVVDIYLKSFLGAEIEKTWTDGFEVIDKDKVEEEEAKKEADDDKADTLKDVTDEVEEEEIEDDDEIEKEEGAENLIDKEPEIIEKTVIINKGEKGFNFFYAFLLVLSVFISSYFYLKFKISNKNKFNKGWKIK